MKRVEAMVARLCASPPAGLRLRRKSDGLIATLVATGRHQEIEIQGDGEQVVLTSVVLDRKRVTASDKGWRELVRRVWERNRLTDLVLFAFDRDDNLVGRAVHPIPTLDHEELVLYVEALLLECDRFEYVLTGEDRS